AVLGVHAADLPGVETAELAGRADAVALITRKVLHLAGCELEDLGRVDVALQLREQRDDRRRRRGHRGVTGEFDSAPSPLRSIGTHVLPAGREWKVDFGRSRIAFLHWRLLDPVLLDVVG